MSRDAKEPVKYHRGSGLGGHVRTGYECQLSATILVNNQLPVNFCVICQLTAF